MKAICVLRVSTDRQDIQQQKQEMKNFITLNGFSEEQVLFIEGVGASAIKLNDRYLAMIQAIKQAVEDNPDARTIFIWHLNRLGRNDDVLIQLKNYFIQNRIQLIVKEPSLKLLNDDGSVNSGAELAYGLFATMVKQDMAEKQAKFKRAKDYKRKQGKCVTGNPLYGYTTDENNYLIEGPEAANVRIIYELYATGKFSHVSLLKELQERGIAMTSSSLARMLKQPAYIGKCDDMYLKYPPIISEDLYNRVAAVRKNNNYEIEKGNRIMLGTKIVKCTDCGGNYYCESNHYVCYHNRKHLGCNNTLSANADVVDSILWNIASIYHMDYMANLNEQQAETYKQEVKVIGDKLDVLYKKERQIELRKDRVLGSYFKGEIDEQTKDKWLSSVTADRINIQRSINDYQEQQSRIQNLIDGINYDINRKIERDVDMDFEIMEEQDRAVMRDIVKKHIKAAYLAPKHLKIGKDTFKGFTAVVGLANGQEWHLFYAANKRVGNRLYLLTQNEYRPYVVDIIRRDGGI